ncbi:diguanylate cyclase domain-containing protein [Roseicyclus marinus]|uniref:diguanylate cyclase domain-containing protein n=1 Tax=Roseicyclus marinus TaxID=2161673 RepID=UPI0024108C39|nr:diguanylate cyclase [Roseicyclus marinus]MDG3040615.1 diguanylate cyclase [Roseicyclus marinus]
MTGRILVVDDVATNRIVMKVKLAAACYAVEQADCGLAALAVARSAAPDLILLDVVMPEMSGLEVCRRLKADPETADIPVILVTALADHASKMAGLEAGADDFLTKPVDEVTLLARVRSLLRARDTARELKLRGQTTPGFAEAAAGFAARETPGRIALIASGPKGAVLWKTALDDRLGGEVSILPRDAALGSFGADDTDVPDVFVIAADLSHRNEGLRLLSDLRSRPATRHAATVMILPDGDAERAAIALDLGAHDILYDPFDAAELAIRIRAQLGRKRQADRLRASLRLELEMAVTDSLTGLHNRRKGLFELERMLARDGTAVAVMLLDIDHFKQVNDVHGHAVGDSVLHGVARRLRSALRSGDLLARIGGEEFLVALPDCDAAHALSIAEGLRKAVAGQAFCLDAVDRALAITLSVGIALSRPGSGETTQSLLDRADAALYGAKAHGRDQVTLSNVSAA